MYFDLLKRTQVAGPSQADINAWVNTGYDLLTVRVLVAGSAEYYLYG